MFPAEGQAHIVLTVRADTLGHHSGQVSLPGGVVEPAEDLVNGVVGGVVEPVLEPVKPVLEDVESTLEPVLNLVPELPPLDLP